MLSTTRRRAVLPRTLWASPRTRVPTAQLSLSLRAYSVVNAPLPKKRKVWDSVDEAVRDVKSGDVILSGGKSRRCLEESAVDSTFRAMQGLDSVAHQIR